MKVGYEGVEIELRGGGLIPPDPDWKIGKHAHDDYEIHFITGGAGCNVLDHGELDLYPNIVYVAPPGEAHAQYSDKTSPLELYYI
jgi:mannose-6-phosphate isomerase-like protein (cupin superfamily)